MHEGWVSFFRVMIIFLGNHRGSKMSHDSLVLVGSESHHAGLCVLLFATPKMTKFQQPKKTQKWCHIKITQKPLFEASTGLCEKPSLVDINWVKVRWHGFVCFAV